MKKLLRLLAAAGTFWLAPAAANAQYYYIPFQNAGSNPAGLNTDQEQPVSQLAGWTTMLTGTTVTRNTPAWTSVASLPFPFQFNGQAVSRFRVATTGVLSFDTTAAAVPGTNNVGLPSADVPANSICVWGINTGPSDYIISKTFGTAPNRQFWVQFNSASQGTTNAVTTFWSIVLQETTNTIYLVDQRTTGGNLSLTLGLQYSATQAFQVNGSPNINSRALSNNPSPSDNSYYMFEPGTQPANDMTVRALTLPTMVGANAPIVITGSVRNLGTQPVTSYQIAYSVNGGTPVVDNLSAAIGSLGTGPFTHSVPFTPTAAGTYTVKAWTAQPNGQPDAKPFNDTISRVIQVADSSVQRTIVMESFTSSTCPPCRPGNINIRAVQAANPGKLIKIAYQQNFPAPGNDPYYTQESGARFGYYNGSFVPYMMLDGGWGDNSNSLTTAIVNQFYNVPAFLEVKGSMNRVGSTINATAIITPYLNYDAGLVCHMAIVEKHTRNNARTNGERDFYNVMKKMMPDENGTPLPALAPRQPYTLSLSYTFPAGNNVEHLDSLEVVMFVQNPTTKQVLNGVMYDQQRVTALADEVTFGPLSVAPNPAVAGESAVRLSLPTAQQVSVEVLDALGRVVATVPARELTAGAHALPLQLNASAHGMYVVRVKTGATTRVRRLVIE